MLKEEVLKKLEEYKGRLIEVGLADEGAVLYSGIDGHFLFTSGNNLVEVKKNAGDGTYGHSSGQQQYPFKITVVNFDTVNYVRTYFGKEIEDIGKIISGLEPVGTNFTFEEIKKKLETDNIRKALSPRGNVNDGNTDPGSSYGRFTGSVVSTNIDGLPDYYDSLKGV